MSCFGCEKKNGRTVGGTFYSFHNELLSRNIAGRQLDGQHLKFGDPNSHLSSKHALNRDELNIDEGKHVLACFQTSNYFE